MESRSRKPHRVIYATGPAFLASAVLFQLTTWFTIIRIIYYSSMLADHQVTHADSEMR
jgi:hypothetical protein